MGKDWTAFCPYSEMRATTSWLPSKDWVCWKVYSKRVTFLMHALRQSRLPVFHTTEKSNFLLLHKVKTRKMQNNVYNICQDGLLLTLMLVAMQQSIFKKSYNLLNTGLLYLHWNHVNSAHCIWWKPLFKNMILHCLFFYGNTSVFHINCEAYLNIMCKSFLCILYVPNTMYWFYFSQEYMTYFNISCLMWLFKTDILFCYIWHVTSMFNYFM